MMRQRVTQGLGGEPLDWAEFTQRDDFRAKTEG